MRNTIHAVAVCPVPTLKLPTMRGTLLIAIFFGSISLFANDPDSEKTPRDTASAVVVYDAEVKFLPSIAYRPADYTSMIDSLLLLERVPLSLINQLSIYRMLSAYESDALSNVIDSIFDTNNVPQPTLNAVNLYLTAIDQELTAPHGFAAFAPQGTSPFPASGFYDDWNTAVPNPIRNSLATFDSTLQLLLVDDQQNCGFYPPFRGVVTSNFGWRYGRNHNGIDIDLEVWDPVHSAFPGVVRLAKFYEGFGRVVVVRHHNGLETIYAHLHRFSVKAGQEVEAGDVVGLGGSSGNSTGSHLHFEIRFQGVPIKPSQVIDFRTHELRSPVINLARSGAFLAAAPAGQVIYEVQNGDYLYKIAGQFGVSVSDICTLNGINPKSGLKAGQKLIVGT